MRRFTILGCGSSLGSPWINKYKGILNLKNKRNIRTRCCAHIQYDKLSIILDTSPDIKKASRRNNECARSREYSICREVLLSERLRGYLLGRGNILNSWGFRTDRRQDI